MRYFKAFFRRFFSLMHCVFIKLFHWRHFSFQLEEMISNRSSFRISENGFIKIGKRIGVRSNCNFSVCESGMLVVGDDCFFNNGCIIACHEKIDIGDNTRFGPNVMVFDHDYDFRNIDSLMRNKHLTEPIKIGKNVWIGAGCILLRGTDIGDDCVVGAGCILRGKIESGTIITQKRTSCIKEIKR